jgi:hypothetical protein
MKEDKKQTAVEWFEDTIQSDMSFIEIMALIRQTKALEKQQIIEAHIEGQPFHSVSSHKAEQYYKETYEAKEM